MPARIWEATPGRSFVGRLTTGSDLTGEIERYCLEQGIVAAQVSVIGAVRRAHYAYYEQDTHAYHELESDTHHEITGFIGNISERDGKPFLHAHATFADAAGATVGGHLLSGTDVFAAEVIINELEGVSLVRRLDEESGLSLW